MRVTPDMKTEGGQSLSELADLLGEDQVGVKAETHPDGTVKLTVDSTAYPNKSVWLDPDDADALGDLLKMRAREARGVL